MTQGLVEGPAQFVPVRFAQFGKKGYFGHWSGMFAERACPGRGRSQSSMREAAVYPALFQGALCEAGWRFGLGLYQSPEPPQATAALFQGALMYSDGEANASAGWLSSFEAEAVPLLARPSCEGPGSIPTPLMMIREVCASLCYTA